MIKKQKLSKNPYKWSHSNKIRDNFNKFEKEISNLLRESNFKLVQNISFGVVYYFEIFKTVKILNYILSKGEYILKIEVLTDLEISNLLKLSKLKLIPHIYFIDYFSNQDYDSSNYYATNNRYIMVMDYIDGENLETLIKKNDWRYISDKDIATRTYIYNQIKKEFKRWDSNVIGDLSPKNILINKEGKVYFIDPLIYRDVNMLANKVHDFDDLGTIRDILRPDLRWEKTEFEKSFE